jgi:hypothetical protein
MAGLLPERWVWVAAEVLDEMDRFNKRLAACHVISSRDASREEVRGRKPAC